jgi:DNA-binding NarL/FixJ family response regulator
MPASLVEERFQTVQRSRIDSVREPMVVAILAAYPSVRAGLASLLQADDSIRPTSVQFQSLLSAESLGTALPLATDLVLVDPGDIPKDALVSLVNLARAEDLQVLWIGVPQIELPAQARISAVTPDVDAATLVAAIRAVAEGLIVIDPDLDWNGLPSGPTNVDTPLGGGLLSPREQEVLQLVAAGLPNKAIARELGISDHTVKFHVSSLLTKLDAGSRTEAVTVATRRGLLFL